LRRGPPPWAWTSSASRRPELLIRSIALRNVRSYNDGEEAKVVLPEGVVLFEGDIGSGKSTLLYAVEFALFGFSGMKGTHLLSEGKNDGYVSVVIESGGKEYTVERKLRAKKDEVSQDDCAIAVDGRKERFSPTDMKERVVSILGYNEPTHPKAESLVYRYAVFTPQEQMKSILTQDAEDRLHVIRRVLGAQSYQVAAENSSVVQRRIEKVSYGLRKSSEDLAEKKRELKEKSETEEILWSSIPRLESEAKESERVVAELESRWKELTKKSDALSRIAGRVEPLQESIAELEERIDQDRSARDELKTSLTTEVLPIIARHDSTKKPELSVRELTAENSSLGRRLATLQASKESMQSESSKHRELMSNGVCPTCGQTLPKDFAKKSQHIESELRKIDEEMEDLGRKTAALEADLERGREFEELEKDHARATKDRSRTEREIDSLTKRIGDAEERLKGLKAELSRAKQKSGDLDEISRQIEDVEPELAKARAAEKRTTERLGKAQMELSNLAALIEHLSAEVAKMERAADRARRLTHYEDWLGGYFRPTVEQIEKQAMREAAARFNEHFQRFFTTLVDDPDMVVRVREDFSPVFEREGFDQDYDALSGGERTSMALAYRFALNAVIRDNLASQPELVVLDEPTDGFSKEQVYKMRSLLEELDSRQVIMVSHEKELESMADHIFRVEKVNGVSRVTKITGHLSA
jgi:DNA repair protein SbcC/Rad50